MNNDKIVYNERGEAVSFVGHDAVKLFQAAALCSGLGLLAKGIKPARGWTIKGALATASIFTGKQYKRTQIAQARMDLQIWIQTMKAALPQETVL